MPRGCKTTCISQPRGSRMRLGPSESSLHMRAATRPDPALLSLAAASIRCSARSPLPGSSVHLPLCPALLDWDGIFPSFQLSVEDLELQTLLFAAGQEGSVCCWLTEQNSGAGDPAPPRQASPPGPPPEIDSVLLGCPPPHLPGERRRRLLVSERYYRD